MDYYRAIITELEALADPRQAAISQRFFKTAPGQYGAGDIFWGIKVPQQRSVAKKYAAAAAGEIERLLHSPIHEQRLVALLILIEQYGQAEADGRAKISEFYLRHLKSVNNWDLVDLSTPKILGPYLFPEHKGTGSPRAAAILDNLVSSQNLWERRIAMLSAFYPISRGRHQEAFRLAKRLLSDQHDLIHKAVGWMLRETGKKAGTDKLRGFLDAYAVRLPRTALRYAIERLPEDERRAYLAKRPV